MPAAPQQRRNLARIAKGLHPARNATISQPWAVALEEGQSTLEGIGGNTGTQSSSCEEAQPVPEEQRSQTHASCGGVTALTTPQEETWADALDRDMLWLERCSYVQ